MRAKHYELECAVYYNENEINVLAEANGFCHRNNIEVDNIIVRPTPYDEHFKEWECFIYYTKLDDSPLKW